MKPPIERECEAQFRDAHCAYSGTGNWCDGTRSRCAALGNLDRFNMRQPPVREDLLSWPQWLGIALTVATWLWVDAWSLALPCYLGSLVVSLPHFWTRLGLFGVMMFGQPADERQQETRD